MLGLHLSCNRVSFLLCSYSPPVLGVIPWAFRSLEVLGGAHLNSDFTSDHGVALCSTGHLSSSLDSKVQLHSLITP